jgi:hypothetical protein
MTPGGCDPNEDTDATPSHDGIGQYIGTDERPAAVNESSREDCAGRMPDGPGESAKKFDLCAAALVAQHPAAEVLAVVGQHAISAFAQTRPRTVHRFARIKPGGRVSNTHVAATSEFFERNIFHRPAPQSMCEAGVVNDATIADVDAVVIVERPRNDQMAGKRWLLPGTKEIVAQRIQCPPRVHGK